jgi:hypothetical protein
MLILLLQPSSEVSLFANYDSLKTFEERLEYVYTCLKKVEDKKLAQVSDEMRGRWVQDGVMQLV